MVTQMGVINMAMQLKADLPRPNSFKSANVPQPWGALCFLRVTQLMHEQFALFKVMPTQATQQSQRQNTDSGIGMLSITNLSEA